MNKIDLLCLCFLIVNLKCIIVFGSKIDSSFHNLSIKRTPDDKSIHERETPLGSTTQTPTTQTPTYTIPYTKTTFPTVATTTFRPKPTQYSHLLKLIFNLKIEIDE